MNTDYSVAVHALVYLAHMGRTQKSDQLAENICTNAARVRKVMGLLGKHQLVITKEGIDGGYALLKEAKEITLRDVAKALGTAFVSVTWKPGDVDKNCLVSSGMGGVMDTLYKDMNQLCLEHAGTITIQAIVDYLFKGKKKENAEQEV